MAQRAVIGTCLLLSLVSLAAVGLVWQQSTQAQRNAAETARAAAETARFMASMNESSQARDREMLKQLQKMSAALQNPRSPDWNPLSFKLTQETSDGPPAVGYSVRLKKLNGDQDTKDETSDAAGVADFGFVPPGPYQFQVTKGWHGGAYRSSWARLVIVPESQNVQALACPKVPPDLADVGIACEWPQDLKGHGLVTAASFLFEVREIGNGPLWQLVDSGFEMLGTAPQPGTGLMLRLQSATDSIRTVRWHERGRPERIVAGPTDRALRRRARFCV